MTEIIFVDNYAQVITAIQSREMSMHDFFYADEPQKLYGLNLNTFTKAIFVLNTPKMGIEVAIQKNKQLKDK